MSALRQALVGYLAVRRACGYHLDRPEKLLGQFLSYLDDAQADTVTTEHTLAWATLPRRERTLACLPASGGARVCHLPPHPRSSDTGTARGPDPGSTPRWLARAHDPPAAGPWLLIRRSLRSGGWEHLGLLTYPLGDQVSLGW